MEPKLTTIEEARRWASLFLERYNREGRVADLLLENMLGLSFAMLLAHGRDPITEENVETFIKKVKEHAKTGIPLQHLTGQAHFYGRTFQVNEDVLIPRPETEELIERVLQRLRPSDKKIADIGTGSGIIAITIQLESRLERQVMATDISREALTVAKANADKHDTTIKWFTGNFLAPLADQSIDVLISNPPYIARDEQLDDTVKNFDPSLALFANHNGLAAYQTIVQQIQQRSKQPRMIVFEIGHHQGRAIKELFNTKLANYQVAIEQDINQKDRMIFAIKDS
ncbi:peptide chain release factor N(5)-glutamine methyltransferase [Halobacillus seohaensis]|uniref:Release factor glutamine methyltransferase n=1 Tax=Halobacillus seohaensis TaxID=447421 RepID=A0ABW2EJC4_9BACI